MDAIAVEEKEEQATPAEVARAIAREVHASAMRLRERSLAGGSPAQGGEGMRRRAAGIAHSLRIIERLYPGATDGLSWPYD